jgi:NAD-dependent deacetylase
MSMNTDLLIEQAADLISRAQAVTALTGAGLSTPSGVPDFRSPREGLWENVDVMEIATIYAFRHKPRAFYDWLRPLLATVLHAQPNAAHLALADLERQGALDGLITQNIDLLHTRAGSVTVYEVHGHLRDIACIACHYLAPAAPYFHAFMAQDVLPVCPRCHHVMKPTVTLFGELLPRQAMKAAQQATQTCGLMLVAGTSLEVAPVGDLPLAATQHGARLIIVNRMPTPADDRADVIIRGDVAEVLPRLAACVRERRDHGRVAPDPGDD